MPYQEGQKPKKSKTPMVLPMPEPEPKIINTGNIPLHGNWFMRLYSWIKFKLTKENKNGIK